MYDHRTHVQEFIVYAASIHYCTHPIFSFFLRAFFPYGSCRKIFTILLALPPPIFSSSYLLIFSPFHFFTLFHCSSCTLSLLKNYYNFLLFPPPHFMADAEWTDLYVCLPPVSDLPDGMAAAHGREPASSAASGNTYTKGAPAPVPVPPKSKAAAPAIPTAAPSAPAIAPEVDESRIRSLLMKRLNAAKLKRKRMQNAKPQSIAVPAFTSAATLVLPAALSQHKPIAHELEPAALSTTLTASTTNTNVAPVWQYFIRNTCVRIP